MPIYVPGYGNPHARLMIVGEAPGENEERVGIPFVGASGDMVNEMLQLAGLDPSEIYKTNVCKVRPPDNDIKKLSILGCKIEDFEQELWREIEAINPNCILAFGNTALKALTGETGIQKYRGSILPNRRMALPKVVSTIHPASLMHKESDGMSSWRDRAFIKFDVARAVEESLTREYRPPSRILNYAKSSLDVVRFIERNVNQKGLREVSTDIETFKAIPMCIGFAFSRYEALSIPLFNILAPLNPEGIPMHDMVFIWQLVADLLLDPQYKIVGHNLKFDQGRLEEIQLNMRWPYFDTQLGFHTMFPEMPKKLQFVSSILTKEPYYKDELEEYSPKKEKLIKRLLYNAKDCAVEFEVFEEECKYLKEIDRYEWFFEHMMPRHKFYYQMERRGVLVDKHERARLIKKYERYTKLIHRIVERDLGYELNVNSPKQVGGTLFGNLKCPVRKDVGEETLEMLMLNAVKDDKRRRIIKNILKERKSRKTESTYIKAKLWEDGRIRTVYNITGTESNRTSTSKPKPPVTMEPMGVAFQTITKHGDVGADIRKAYIPDPGYCLMEADGAQAEARVVALLARDEQMFHELNRTDFIRNKHGIKDDIHTKTTILVTGMDFEAITDEDRQLGKKTRHAGNYKMGKRRLSLLAQISEWKAGKCLELFHAANPNIEHVFWEEIRQALYDNDQTLVSANGFRRQFFDRWGEDLFKEAYAFIPQNVVSDNTKEAALRVEKRAPWTETYFVAESHDSFTILVPIDKIKETAAIVTEEMERPIDFSRCSLPRDPLVIPCEIQLGFKNWKEMISYDKWLKSAA